MCRNTVASPSSLHIAVNSFVSPKDSPTLTTSHLGEPDRQSYESEIWSMVDEEELVHVLAILNLTVSPSVVVSVTTIGLDSYRHVDSCPTSARDTVASSTQSGCCGSHTGTHGIDT